MSTHPLANAIKEYSSTQLLQHEHKLTDTSSSPTEHPSLPVPVLRTTEEVVGRGLVCDFGSFTMILGSANLLHDRGIPCQDASPDAQSFESQGMTLVYIGITNAHKASLMCILAVADPPRPEATRVVDYFHRKNIQVYMLTGDNRQTAEAIGKQVGIPQSHVFAQLLPLQKQDIVKKLQISPDLDHVFDSPTTPSPSISNNDNDPDHQHQHHKVLFVGDGVNDAAALAQADVGVSLDTGSSMAQNSADFVILVNNEVQSDSGIIEKSPLVSLINGLLVVRATRRRIILNIAWAVLFNLVLIPLAAGAFYDAGQTRLPPVWASLAMALSSISVVCSSLLLKYTFHPVKFQP